jgi:hypothetical protein
LLQKDNECFGSKSEPNGQITVNIVLYGGTVLYGRTPSFQTDRTYTVLYGVLRYGTVITVKKAEVRRISTSLIMNQLTDPTTEKPAALLLRLELTHVHTQANRHTQQQGN